MGCPPHRIGDEIEFPTHLFYPRLFFDLIQDKKVKKKTLPLRLSDGVAFEGMSRRNGIKGNRMINGQ